MIGPDVPRGTLLWEISMSGNPRPAGVLHKHYHYLTGIAVRVGASITYPPATGLYASREDCLRAIALRALEQMP